MKKSDDILSTLIERYFAGETTLDEERRLRELLAASADDTPAVREAKAVMGYSLASPVEAPAISLPRRRKSVWRHIPAAAAVAALLLPAGALVFHTANATERPRCVAYVNSEIITDPEVIQQMALDNLREVTVAASALETTNTTTLRHAMEINEEIIITVFPI